jgi:hypothetical protein
MPPRRSTRGYNPSPLPGLKVQPRSLSAIIEKILEKAGTRSCATRTTRIFADDF